MTGAGAVGRDRVDGGLAAYYLLTVLGWLLVNALAGVGAVAMLFVLMANATWYGLFSELAGLAKHFIDAPIAARIEFEALASQFLIIAIVLTCLIRVGALRAALAGAQRRTVHAG